MAKPKSSYRCQECGHDQVRWVGRCPGCGAWGSLIEHERLELVPSAAVFAALGDRSATTGTPVPLAEIDAGDVSHHGTGIGELDRVLGGGLVPGAAILLGGEPGIGKSTLVLQMLHATVRSGRGPVLLITAEESKEQVRLRAERLGTVDPACFVMAEESVAAIAAHIEAVQPSLVVVDSIQTVREPRVSSAAGSVAQVRESASALVEVARRLGATVVLVGHVTKDGSLAGPRVLEHLVDVVISFEGDRHHSLRVLRGVKNRFGPAGELGLFDMREGGLVEMPDASSLFLGDRRHEVSGAVVVPAVQGRRPLLVEVQALVTATPAGAARRTVTGVDVHRVTVLCGVLDKRVQVPLSRSDVFVAAAGGVRLGDPAADLAISLSLVSSWRDLPVPTQIAVVGEVGLGGEVRAVPHLERRIREVARFGFSRLIVPSAAFSDAREVAGADLEVLGVGDVAGAVDAMGWH